MSLDCKGLMEKFADDIGAELGKGIKLALDEAHEAGRKARQKEIVALFRDHIAKLQERARDAPTVVAFTLCSYAAAVLTTLTLTIDIKKGAQERLSTITTEEVHELRQLAMERVDPVPDMRLTGEQRGLVLDASAIEKDTKKEVTL